MLLWLSLENRKVHRLSQSSRTFNPTSSHLVQCILPYNWMLSTFCQLLLQNEVLSKRIGDNQHGALNPKIKFKSTKNIIVITWEALVIWIGVVIIKITVITIALRHYGSKPLAGIRGTPKLKKLIWKAD